MKIRVKITLFLLLLMSSVQVDAETMTKTEIANNIITAMDTIEQEYYGEINQEQLIQGALKGIFDELDKHSVYLPPELYKEFVLTLNGNYTGIGVQIEEAVDGSILIKDIYKGSPTSNLGLKVNDRILFINDESVYDMGYEKAINALLGQPESIVDIGIKRDNLKDIIFFRITRKVVSYNPIEFSILDNNVGYIRIIEFSKDASYYFTEALKEIEKEGAKSLIVDVRNNPGGLMTEALGISEFFTEIGTPILYIESEKGDEIYYSHNEPIDLPTVLLMNDRSASASEIIANVIKENRKGVLIGTPSYGKGTVQNLHSFDDPLLGGFKVTTAEFLSTNRVGVPQNGITPDIYIENESDFLKGIIESFASFDTNFECRLGDRNSQVYALEQRLEIIGYRLGVDGVYDNETEDAVESFQIAWGLEGNGQSNIETNKYLEVAVRQLRVAKENDRQLQEALKFLTQ